MIKTFGPILPPWIERQASLGWKEGNILSTEDNAFWAMLYNACPLIFESYAIVLHPFGINWESKALVESDLYEQGLKVYRDDTGMVNLSWKDFLAHYGYPFDLKTAFKYQAELTRKISALGWPVYLWGPSEGTCDEAVLKFIIDQVIKFYGDQVVSYFYIFMLSKKWDTDDFNYTGKLSDFHLLENDDALRCISPTAIYPDDKRWCVVSDFDSPFTFVGGPKEFIGSIVNQNQYEIFEIVPMNFERE